MLRYTASHFGLMCVAATAVLATVPASASGNSNPARFERLDADHNGVLSRSEAKAAPGLAARYDELTADNQSQPAGITRDEFESISRNRGSRASTRDTEAQFNNTRSDNTDAADANEDQHSATRATTKDSNAQFDNTRTGQKAGDGSGAEAGDPERDRHASTRARTQDNKAQFDNTRSEDSNEQ
ncbi:hypothetical protein V5738_03875 [Salinisphaera sp. SPP-AMP-43]|uniref:hypothetical protein n=1 Tax=Salinisphaera sp. SPP-AMP-43 TaxID=3121288 RepID=UPI003C6E08D9